MLRHQNWTPEITRKIDKIKEKAWSYTWIHRENSIYLADIYEWISIIAYSLSFFNGVILFFPTNLIYIRIFNILLSFGSGLLVFYIKNKKLTETAEKHKIASSKFSNIYNNIERQVSLEPDQRENALHYHRWISQVFDALYGSAPDIDPPIIDEYIRKFAKKRRVNPIEAAEFDRDTSVPSHSDSSSSSSHEIIIVGDQSETESPPARALVSPSGTQGSFSDDEKTASEFGPKQLKLSRTSVARLNNSNNNHDSNHGDNNNSHGNEIQNEDFLHKYFVPRRNKHRMKNLDKLENHARTHLETQDHEIDHDNPTNRQKLLNYELSRMEMGNMTMGTKCYIPEYEFKNKESNMSTNMSSNNHRKKHSKRRKT